MKRLNHREGPLPPVLSICIPTWNRAGRLAAMLDVLEPFLGDEIELVVSDNGSTDKTREVLGAFAGRRSAAQLSFWTNEVNIGADANYLRVLELARGAWLWMVGDDEAIVPASIPDLVAQLRPLHGIALLSSPAPHLPDLPETAVLDLHGFLEPRHDTFGVAMLQIGRFVMERAAVLPHLRRAYSEGIGHLHAYGFLSLTALREGATLHVLRVANLFPSISEEAVEKPRWNQLAGQVGAWRSSAHALAGHPLAHARERRLRSRAIVASGIWQLSNGGRLGMPLSLWMIRALPVRVKAQGVVLLALDLLPGRARHGLLQAARRLTGRRGQPARTETSEY